MPRKKKEQGRPIKRRYPPRTDATVDELVSAFFGAGPSPVEIDEGREYNCGGCGRGVYYPEILYRDGRCADCTSRPVPG